MNIKVNIGKGHYSASETAILRKSVWTQSLILLFSDVHQSGGC